MFKQSVVLLSICGLIVLSTMLPMHSSNASQAAQRPTSHVDFNHKYGQIDRTAEGLAQYKNEVLDQQREVESSGLESVHSTITLQTPLSINDALELIDKYDLNVKLLYAYAKAGDELITIGTAFKRKRVGKQLSEIIDSLNTADFIGIVALISDVKVAELSGLQAEDRVFLVDVSADEHFSENPGNRDYMQSFAWDLYHMSR